MRIEDPGATTVAEADTAGAERPGGPPRRIVVVPRTPGPLRDLVPEGPATRDELDQLIDDVFGPTPDDRPGVFDVLLLVAGVLLFAWGLATGASSIVFIAAGAAVILGLVLPARSLLRTVRRKSTDRRWRRALGAGRPLDVTHPATAALVDAYDAFLEAARLPGTELDEQAIEPAHLALVEVATLLGGAPPAAPAQVEYVEKRTRAIRSITDQLDRAHQAWADSHGAAGERALRRRQVYATAITEAREEFEAADRYNSLDRLGRLGRELTVEADDGSS